MARFPRPDMVSDGAIVDGVASTHPNGDHHTVGPVTEGALYGYDQVQPWSPMYEGVSGGRRPAQPDMHSITTFGKRSRINRLF